jgi:glycosyltransferase involved in cell wall biosynthesis
VGLLDEGQFTDLSDAWTDFRSRARARGYLNLDVDVVNQGLRANSNQSCILILVHAGSGGARYATEELLRAASASCRCLLLKAAISSWSLYEVKDEKPGLIRHYRFSDAWRLGRKPGMERESVLKDICEQFGVALVNVHHFLCTGPAVIDQLKGLNLPVVVSFHDFFSVCPTAHLIDNNGIFCGGECSPGNGACPVDETFVRTPVPRLKHDYVYRHRQGMNEALAQCDAFTTPSLSTRDRLLNTLDSLQAEDFHVVGHGCDLERKDLAAEPRNDLPVKIACLGNLNEAKGARLIHELMKLDVEHDRRFEFHFLGRQPRSFAPETLGGVFHGAYERGDCLDQLAEIAPSFSLLASICEETWSYTLSESWAAGLPVFASDRGALKERIGKLGGGWLFNPESAADFYHGMLAVAESSGPWREQVKVIRNIPLQSSREEAENMMRIFSRFLRQSSSLRVARPGT